MTIKAVFFDIDGTLLTDNRMVSSSTILAINALKEKGILVGLATGRDPRFVLQYMASLGLDLAIAYNGQYIFSREEVIYSQSLEPKQIEQIMEYAQTHHKDLSFGTAKGIFGSKIMSAGTGNFAYRVTRMIPESWAGIINFVFNRLVRWISPQQETNLKGFLFQPIYQLMLLTTERETQSLEVLFPNLSFTRSSPYATDIISKGNSKLSGIVKVAERYGFELDEVMVFGDSNNDFEMLNEIQYSVAMGNGTKKVKQAASFVTDTNNRDGIYKALIHFGVIEG
ncbi:haloacid dehalogenase [Streptococcus suis]|uniref:Haloacid dehalogenase n=1 Tax=Streptococcus suis TaxID=1307 RepID=A0AAD0KTV0_STRSU|nr:haloacid dehalogenase [Streptococcus suis]AWX96843.1 haloacid dehalogenase [Streptococcus suis]MBS8057220.1 Cof-type HAD-IIB family hydrolase [Streptococcus suis]HEM3459453.1 Cof-type HAD-IIB family hydrolase [Streptococcus suis]HEM3487497.1 Cof-type HAD-IIB family hydrolase [Streptococcus suis]